MDFEFATATRIVFGPGTIAQAGKIVAEWSPRALVVTGKALHRADRLLSLLEAAGVSSRCFAVAHEPSTATVLEGLAAARDYGAKAIVGFGGGSAIDTAKAIAGLATNPGDPLDYLEVVGRGQPLTQSALPWLAIPTTAGTGAEVTRNAVLSVPEQRVKVSLRSPALLARVALVDPELLLNLPPALTASTGLDALTQLIEAYVSIRANPMTDALCAEAIPRMARALPEVWKNPQLLSGRTDLAFGSLSSGIALANTGLGAVHGFAGPIGGMYEAPHGAICAALLAPVMRVNLAALRQRGQHSPALSRFTQLASWLTGNPRATAEEGIAWVAQLVTTFQIPGLHRFGVEANDAPEIISRAQQASSTKGNPIVLQPEELSEALAAGL